MKLERLSIGASRVDRNARKHTSRRFAAVLLATLACAAGPAWAAGTFYVDVNNPNANESGPGTEAVPYRSINTAVRLRGGPGTTILVKPGTYLEQVTVQSSGSAAQPFIIKSLGTPVMIDGSDLFAAGLWADGPGDSWVTAGVDSAPSQVFLNNTRLTETTAAPASMPTNSFRFITGQGLYVNIGGANPGTAGVRLGLRQHGFRLSGDSYVTVEGFQVTRTEGHGIYMTEGAQQITVRNNVVTFSAAHGISMTGGSDFLIEGNIVSDCGDHGINLLTNVTFSTIQDNESFRHARGFERAAIGIKLAGCSNNLLQRNRVHDNEDTGIEFDSGSHNNVSVQNISWNNGDHGFDHIASTGCVQINDVSYGNTNDGISVEGGSTGTRAYNCIAVNNGLGTGRYNLYVDNSSMAGFTSNYNIFWKSNPAASVIRWGNVNYQTVFAFSQATDHDAQTHQSDPLFVNPAVGDFHIKSGSHAIDSGISSIANWPIKDAAGTSRVDDAPTPNTGVGPVTYADRGAYEFVRSGSVDVGAQILAELSLGPAYPNPARGSVAFALNLARGGRVDWYVTDILGRVVYEEAREFAAGPNQFRWDAVDNHGKGVSPGMYVVRVNANGEMLARQFAVVR